MLCPLFADDLVLCGESEEDLRTILRYIIKVCRRRGLKVNARKSKVMVGGLRSGIRLKDVSEFKYLGCILNESGTDEAECLRKVASGRRVAGVLGFWLMLWVCSLKVLGSYMSHCWCLFLRMVVRQCYGRRRRDLE